MKEIRVLLTLSITDPSRISKGMKLKVKHIEETDKRITAVVKNDRDITCFVDLETGKYCCSCEDFKFRKVFCKHLVALLMATKKKKEVLEVLKNQKIEEIKNSKISTGSETLDKFFGGGIPGNAVTNIIGSSKIGKTTFAVQVASKLSIETGNPVIYLDTEAMFATVDARKRLVSVFEKRFNGNASIDFVDVRDISTFADYLGLMVEVNPTEKKKRLDAMINYDTEITESPLYELVEAMNYKMIVVDSLSALIKRTIPVPPQQNYPARAAIINVFFGRLDEIASKLNVPVVMINHISRDPTSFDRGKLFGGSAMIYNSKFIVQILAGSKSIYKKFRLLYAPGRKEEEIEVEFRDDYGYV